MKRRTFISQVLIAGASVSSIASWTSCVSGSTEDNLTDSVIDDACQKLLEAGQGIDRFKMVEGTKNIFRSSQFNQVQLKKLLETGLVKHVVRLNGDGKNDADILSSNKEKSMVTSSGAEFHRMNFHGPANYIEGKGHILGAYDIGEKLRNLAEDGIVIFHCRHGFDRAGVVSAALQIYEGFCREDIIKNNEWEKYPEKIERTGNDGYREYYDILNNANCRDNVRLR